MALEIGVLTVLAHVDSASDHYKGDLVITLIQRFSHLAVYDDTEDSLSSQRG